MFSLNLIKKLLPIILKKSFFKYKFKNIWINSEGFVFSTDLLLSLIIITVIIGISADAMDFGNALVGDYSSRAALERCTLEAADILIETPGSPYNWEKMSISSGISPGLAISYNYTNESSSNILSWEKIVSLGKKYSLLVDNKIFSKNIKSSIIIYPFDRRIDPLVLKNDAGSILSSEVFLVNRTVQCNFFSNYTVISINWHQNNCTNLSNNFLQEASDICPHDESNSDLNHMYPQENEYSNYWVCKHFTTSIAELEKTDYYLITEPAPIPIESVYWVIDTVDNISNENNSFTSSPIKLNGQIKDLIGNKNNTTIWIHFLGPEKKFSPFKIFLVGVPKNTEYKYIKAEYFQLQKCSFVLKTWF